MTVTATSRNVDSNPRLFLSMELSARSWKLGFSTGFGQKARRRTIAAKDLRALDAEIERARQRFSLAPETPVMSCYEAGPDGFWIHRALEERGVSNLVIDSASIEVNRRKRRAKSDGIDVEALLNLLMRYIGGEDKALRVVRVPPAEIEDWRELHRDLETLKAERIAMRNRIQSLLATRGCKLHSWTDARAEIERMRQYDGRPLGEQLKARLLRELDRVGLVQEQMAEISKQQARMLYARPKEDDPEWLGMMRRLMQLRGVGVTSAWVLVLEAFAWRDFKNRRQVGGYVGLTPTPYQSGGSGYEQGISKAGNVWMRKLSVQLAWGWLRWQANSDTAQRFAKFSAKPRQRRVGIVLVARRLMIDLWRYACAGQLPAGAVLSVDKALELAVDAA